MYKPIKIISSEFNNNKSEIIQECNFPNKSLINEQKKLDKFKIISKNLKNVSLNILKNRKQNPKVLNLSNNYVTELHLIKYRPKRLAKLKEQGNSKIPFTELGGNSFGLDTTNKSVDKNIKINYKTRINILSNLLSDTNNNDNLGDNEFKSYYILKFAKNSEDFKKIKNHSDLMTDNMTKRVFDEHFEKISKLIETQNKLYFKSIEYNQNNTNFKENNLNNNMETNFYFNNPNLPSILFNEITKNRTRNNSVQDIPTQNIFSNTSNNLNFSSNISKCLTPTNNTYITTLSSFNSSNQNNFTKNMKTLFSNWSEIIINFTKFISHILKEISAYKIEHLNLKRKNISDETQLNKVTKELEELKKYLNKFDVNHKIYSQMHKENKINDLKKSFLLKENEYKITIFKLESEIKSLTTLLEKNKIYFNKYIDLSKEIGKNRKENELLKVKFNKELQENNILFLVEKDLKEDLHFQIEKLKSEINEIKKEKNEEKKINVEMQSLIKKLRMEINEKEENIMMLNEELETFIRKYNEEKTKHLIVLKDFNLLENKIFKKKEVEIAKEKVNDDYSDNKESSTPIFKEKINKKDDTNKSPSTTTQNNNSQI